MQQYFSDIDRRYAVDRRLGAVYSHSSCSFAVWAPCAENVRLRLYESCTAASAKAERSMTMDDKGVWRCRVQGDLDGTYYTYLVTYEGNTVETPDIYSRTAGVNGERSMVFSPRSVHIDGWSQDRPVRCGSPADAVIYELHLRDLSMDASADFAQRGKFISLCEENVKNSFGDPAGLDHIRKMGVTHVHLLPVMDFASVDESGDAPHFNWGYDPLHYNVPEGSYSTDPYDGYIRVRELRRMVKALHDHNIGVILDVVYNHTFSSEDSPFGRIFPHYYYRHDREGYSNGSGCGNELATERRMVSKFICDSLCSLARDYHIDGFRFDLLGLMDIRTLNRCVRKLRSINPDIILYGEGWTGGCSPLPDELRALKHHAACTDGVAMFSDDLRDGIKGSVFDDSDCGYINGGASTLRRELIKSVLCGGIFHPDVRREEWQCWAKTPISSVNYVEAHDDLTFHDKLACSMPDADDSERLRVNRMGAALVMLAQGIPFLQAGQELLRSKPDGRGGYVHNSFAHPDSVNCIKWDDVTHNRGLAEYYRGLIAIRRARTEFRMTDAEEIRSAVRFEDLSGNAFVMYIGGLALAVNPNRRSAALKLPKGIYRVLADGERASSEPFAFVKGKVSVPRQSILLLDKEEIV